jgi:protein ImuB
MTKLQAETSGASLRKRSLANEDTAQDALLDCGGLFSPCVESTCPGTVLLDLKGTEKLFGSLENVARKIIHHAAEQGFELRTAMAADPETARLAARGYPGITVIPEGLEARWLAPLAVELLPVSPEMLATLEAWGIQTLRALAALPAVALTERLGQEGLQLQRLARGTTSRLLLPAASPGVLIDAYEFEDPVETLESLTFVLNRLLQQACLRLVSRSLATNQFEVGLDLDVRQVTTGHATEHYEHAWKLPLPIQDGRVLFRLACLDLEKHTFSAPIRKITVTVTPVRPRSVQHGLFVPVSPETEQVQLTLARIRGLVGSTDENGIACVGSPAALDSHRPDGFAVLPFSGLSRSGNAPRIPLCISALRIFRPALETSVETSGNRPHCISIRQKRFRVLAASGPWCNSGQWWHASAWSRDEWDVAVNTLDGVGYYRVYLDKIRKQWFVEGMFD